MKHKALGQGLDALIPKPSEDEKTVILESAMPVYKNHLLDFMVVLTLFLGTLFAVIAALRYTRVLT